MEPFRPQDVGWIEGASRARERLSADPLEILGYISEASNGTILCRLGDPDERLFAVYKPEEGERPLWDFDSGLYRREVAAHVVSEFLGWDLVPPTVERDGPVGMGSVQLFVPHDPALHYFVLVEQPRWHAGLARIALFDLLVNNADRKGGHILCHRRQDRLYGIDHGLTFHAEPKLRTVVWDVAGEPLERAWTADVGRLADRLADADAALTCRLAELLSAAELAVLSRRAERMVEMRGLPRVHPDRRHYPWPPV